VHPENFRKIYSPLCESLGKDSEFPAGKMWTLRKQLSERDHKS
jgi:hypothetical protein